jgi:hypothetical protein
MSEQLETDTTDVPAWARELEARIDEVALYLFHHARRLDALVRDARAYGMPTPTTELHATQSAAPATPATPAEPAESTEPFFTPVLAAATAMATVPQPEQTITVPADEPVPDTDA